MKDMDKYKIGDQLYKIKVDLCNYFELGLPPIGQDVLIYCDNADEFVGRLVPHEKKIDQGSFDCDGVESKYVLSQQIGWKVINQDFENCSAYDLISWAFILSKRKVNSKIAKKK